MKKIALYCRVSSDDQKERETIDNQVEILTTYVEMKENLEIYKSYLDDGISGTVAFEERPAGYHLLEDAKQGLFDTILVWKIDRFGRDTLSGLSAVELLRKYDIEIMSVTEPFDLNTTNGRYQFINYLNMAELERNNILDRMFLGATRAAKKGKWLGGIVPYGYFVNGDGYLEINDQEADIVKKIFDMYVNDKSSTLDIALYLNALNVPTNYSRGKGKGNRNVTGKWRRSTILRVLSNTTYKGIHEYGKRGTRRKETISRKVPQIIDEDFWLKAQKERNSNKAKATRNTKHKEYLLRGLIKCPKCGRPYQGVSYNKGNLSYYVCATKRGDRKTILGETCDNINVPSDLLDNHVWNEILNDVLLNLNKIIKDLKDTSRSTSEHSIKTKDNLILLEQNLKNLENEKSKILNLYRKDLIEELEVEEELKKMKCEKINLEKLIAKLRNKSEIEANNDKIADDFSKLMNKYLDNIDNVDFNKKKELVNILIDEILIEDFVDDGVRRARVDIQYNFPVKNNSTLELAWTWIV